MTKNKFLKLLEEKLNKLNDNDRKKIINKYSNLIDEKIKNNITEKEAILELGDIDKLTNDILKKYKIKSNNLKEAAKDAKKVMEQLDKLTDNISKLIKSGFKNICSNLKKKNGTINFEFIFILFMKFIFSLILILFLQVPFQFISDFGSVFLKIFISPIDKFLLPIWNIVLFIIYILVSFLIVVTILKKYFYIKNKKYTFNPISIIIKILSTIMFLIPIWCINFVLIILSLLIIYLLFQRVSLFGLLIILIGLSLLLGLLADIINSLIYNLKKIYILPFIVSASLIIIGSMIFTYDMKKFVFINNKKENIVQNEFVYEELIKSKTEIDEASILINDNLEDGKIIIKIHCNDFIKPVILKNKNEIEIEFIDLKVNILKSIINDLKKNRIYNYKKSFEFTITVYSNTNTSKLIET